MIFQIETRHIGRMSYKLIWRDKNTYSLNVIRHGEMHERWCQAVVKLSLNCIFYLQAIFKHSSNCLSAGHSWRIKKHQSMNLSRYCFYFQHITTSSQPIIFIFPLGLRGYRQLKLEHRRISSELKRKSLSRKPFTWNYQFSFAPSHKWSLSYFWNIVVPFLLFSSPEPYLSQNSH